MSSRQAAMSWPSWIVVARIPLDEKSHLRPLDLVCLGIASQDDGRALAEIV